MSTPRVVGPTFVFLCHFLNSCGSRHISVSVTSWLPLHYYDPWYLMNTFFSLNIFYSRITHNMYILFWPGDLDLWPMTLTFELDLDIQPLDLHTKIQVRMFVRSPVRARHTHTHTETQIVPKLLHPSLTLGVIKILSLKCVPSSVELTYLSTYHHMFLV